MPSEVDEVVFEIVRARIIKLAEGGAPLLPRTVRFWNRLAGERS